MRKYDYIEFTRVLKIDELMEIGQAGYILVGFSETSDSIRYIFARDETKESWAQGDW